MPSGRLNAIVPVMLVAGQGAFYKDVAMTER
jgi:hypothetical protein